MKNSDKQNLKQLKRTLKHLSEGYRETGVLLKTQIQAIVKNDLKWLNKLIESQTEKLDELQELEKLFKDQLVKVFQIYYPEQSNPSLTRLIGSVKEPANELTKLRDELRVNITDCEQVRKQLIELMNFASDHNSEAITVLSRVKNRSYENYGEAGNITKGAGTALSLNQTI